MKIEIRSDGDIIQARAAAKALAGEAGFGIVDQTKIATAISELARNALKFAGGGVISMEAVSLGAGRGVEIVCSDDGPGIGDLELAMKEGYSTDKGLGMGLPGTRRLMDDFEIDSGPGKGTRVLVRKWL